MLYTDHNFEVCQWMTNLIDAGLLPAADVLCAGVENLADLVTLGDIAPLVDYTQVHLFAGIGGWPHALALAGWPDTAPVWTVSCPCQPFSTAGQKRGEADERHLWPVVRSLIAQQRPAVVFGEQVASPLGRGWLARVRVDLEALGYVVCAADLCAAGVAAPHKRQRLFFAGFHPDTESVVGVGNDHSERRETELQRTVDGNNTQGRQTERSQPGLGSASATDHRVGNPNRTRPQGRGVVASRRGNQRAAIETGMAVGVADTDNIDGRTRNQKTGRHRTETSDGRRSNFWGNAAIVECYDTDDDGRRRLRRFEPGSFPLVDGLPARVVRTRSVRKHRETLLAGFGNAIVPPLAARFIEAAVHARQQTT